MKGKTHSKPTAKISGTPIAMSHGVTGEVFSDATRSKSRMGKSKDVQPENRWQHRTTNPSGASNMAVAKN